MLRSKGAGFSSRVFGSLPYVLMLLPVAAAFVYVRQYGVNAPYNDGLTLIPLFEKLLAGELRFEDLAAQHNEHRIFFPRIVMLLLGLAASFNDVAYMYLIQACLLVTTLALLLAFRRVVSHSLWLFVPVPFLVFNLGQSWNMLQGFQITLVFVQTFTVLCFVLLYLSDGSRRGGVYFCGALAAGTVAAFSSAPGLLVWPLGLFQIFLLTIRRTRLIISGVWALAGVLVWALYLRGYESSETTTWQDSLKNPLESLEYLFSALGASLFHGSQGLAFACGMLMVFLIAAALLLSYRRGMIGRNSVWISLLAFAALTLAATTLARGSNLEDALNPKYVTYSVLAPIAVYALVVGSLGERRDPSAFLALGALGVLTVASIGLSYSQGMSEAREIAENKERTAFVLATHESQPDEILASRGVLRERFRVDAETSRRQANFLENHDYSIFSEPRPEVLPPPLPDPSPGPSDAPSGSVVTGDLRVSLLKPPDGSRKDSFVRISGQALDEDSGESIRGVYILVDGRPYPAFYGSSSPNAQRIDTREPDDPQTEYAGFERGLPVSEIGSGEHELSAIVVTDTGESYLGSNGEERRVRFKL